MPASAPLRHEVTAVTSGPIRLGGPCRRVSWTLGTTSTTRCIEIDATVERVFAFLADPVKSVLAFPMGRNVTVSDIATSPQGAVASYRETMPMNPPEAAHD